MSRIIITTYLFVIIQSHCVELDQTGDDMTYVSDVDGDRTDYDDDNKRYHLTKTGEDGEYIEDTTLALDVAFGRTGVVVARIQEELRRSAKSFQSDFIRTKNRTLHRKKYSALFNAVPAVRTDVIAQLQGQRLKHSNNTLQPYDINFAPPEEPWPAITFRILKATSFSFPTPPPLLTRTFRDHFQSFRPTLTANLERLSKKSSEALSSTRYSSAVSKFWRHFFTTAEPAGYAVYGIIPSNLALLGLINNPGILTRTATSNTASGQVKKTTSRTGGEISYDVDDTYEEDLKKYYELHDDPGKAVFFRPFESVRKKSEKNTTTTTTTTTKKTTTTKTNATRKTRHYPRPNWICYECGRNETKFGSSFCYDVFDNPNGNLYFKRSSLRYRCIGNLSMAYKCFKRFDDVGYYNERGCRDWPPRTSGKTYASKRLRALERMLKDKDNGCIFTPQAYLLSYSRSVQLYVRFHVCVCKGTLCNSVSTISEGRLLVLIILAILGKIL